MKKLYLILILGMFLISFANAEVIGTFKQGQEMQITNYCSTADCTSAKLSSIKYPNGTILSINDAMTKNGNEFNYTYTPSELGEYYFTTCSNPNGVDVCEMDSFIVTTSGFHNKLGFYIILIILSLGLIILGFSINDGWTVIFGAFGLILFGIFILIYGIDGLKDPIYTYSIGIITIMVASYLAIRSAIEQIE